MENTVYIPVKSLTVARRLATKFDGSYFSVTSKKGKLFLGKSEIPRYHTGVTVGYDLLHILGITHIVEVTEASTLPVPPQNNYQNKEVMLLLRHSFSVVPSNPYGIVGKLVRKTSYAEDAFNVSWSNGTRNSCYVINQDIIIIPE